MNIRDTLAHNETSSAGFSCASLTPPSTSSNPSKSCSTCEGCSEGGCDANDLVAWVPDSFKMLSTSGTSPSAFESLLSKSVFLSAAYVSATSPSDNSTTSSSGPRLDAKDECVGDPTGVPRTPSAAARSSRAFFGSGVTGGGVTSCAVTMNSPDATPFPSARVNCSSVLYCRSMPFGELKAVVSSILAKNAKSNVVFAIVLPVTECLIRAWNTLGTNV